MSKDITAVEWFYQRILAKNIKEVFKQAKKMEKKQIMEAWLTTKPITFNGWKKEFEQYYNETFNKYE